MDVGEKAQNYCRRVKVGAPRGARLGGLRVFAAEMQLQSRLFGLGHVGRLELARNVVVRGGYRFIPRRLRERSFRALVSSRRV